MSVVVIRTLGPLGVVRDQVEVPLVGRLPRRILGRLVVAHPYPVNADELMDAAWGETVAQGTLRVQLSRLRGALLPAEIAIDGSDRGWQLNGSFTADHVHFAALAEKGLDSSDTEEVIATTTQALLLWRGAAFEDFRDAPWAVALAEGLTLQQASVRLRLAQVLARTGALDRSIAELRLAVSHNLFDERTTAWLAAALAKNGQPTEGLAVIERLRATLRDELGCDPSEMVRSVELAILQQRPDPTLELSILGSPIRLAASPSRPSEPSRPSDPSLTVPLRTVGADDGPPPSLVGRSAEWSLLRGPTAERERQRVVVFVGEEGIGKSTLAAAYVDACKRDRSATVLVSRWAESDSLVFQPLLDLVASAGSTEHNGVGDSSTLLPDTPSEGGFDKVRSAEQHYASLVGGVLRRLTADAPVIVLLEDLHWADKAAIEALHMLLEIELTRPTVHDLQFVLTQRPVRDRSHPLHRFHTTVGRLGTTLLELPRLDRQAVDALVRLRSHQPGSIDPEIVFNATEGNPLFVTEVVRELERTAAIESGSTLLGSAQVPVPSLIESITNARIGRLSDGARQVLALAACAGGTLPHIVLQGSGDADEALLFSALDECVSAEVLVDEATVDAVTFRHSFFQRVVVEQLTTRDRRRVHLQLARTMAGLRPRPNPIEAARHFLEAGSFAPEEDVIHWSIQAAEACRTRAALDDALRFVDAALERCDHQGTPSIEAQALHSKQRILGARRDTKGAKRYGAQAVTAALAAGDLDLAVAAAVAHSSFGGDDDLDPASIELLTRVRSQVGDRADLRVALDSAISYHRGLWGAQSSVARAEAAATLAGIDPATTSPESIGGVLYALSMASLGCPNLEERRAIAERLISNGVGSEGKDEVARGRRMLTLVALQAGDVVAARHLIAELENLEDDQAQWAIYADAARWAATLEMAGGDWTRAAQLIDDHGRRGQGSAIYEASVGGQRALLAYEKGQLPAAHPVFRLLQASKTTRAGGLALEGLCAAEADDLGFARRRLQDATADLYPEPEHRNHLGDLALTAMLADLLEDAGVAASLGPNIGVSDRRYSGQVCIAAFGEFIFGAADRFAGIAASLCGRHSEALDLLSAARVYERDRGWLACEARTLLSAARAFSRAGRSRDAGQALAEGGELAVKLQMSGLERQFRSLGFVPSTPR